jgi:hypothetical protein
MSGLPAWWLALAEQAQAGLAQGSGPWWSERFLCGQPLFGAPELPFGGPSAVLLLGLGAAGPACWLFLHALLFSSGLALWLRQDGAAVGIKPRAGALIAAMVVAAGLLHPEAAALLGVWAWLPWVLMLAGRAPLSAAAPVCALLACAGSPLVLLLGILGSGKASGWAKGWARSWGLGLLLAAPAALETLRLAPGMASVAFPRWQFGWLGSPLLAYQTGVAGLVVLLLWSGWLRNRETVAALLATAFLALGGPLFAPSGLASLPPHQYVDFLSRHQAIPGALPADLKALESERWTGTQGGLAPQISLQRWRTLSLLGLTDADDLSLANVGWVDGTAPQRWNGAVSAAVVDGAVGPNDPVKVGQGLFEGPLRLRDLQPGLAHGQAWHQFTPQMVAPGLWTVDLTGMPVAGSWAYFSESNDAGWQAVAAVSGAPSARAVTASQGSFLAAALLGGEHGLEWRYGPPYAVLGGLAAWLGLLGWVWLAFRRHLVFGR